MTSCTEFYLDDLMAITAIPIADLSANTAGWQLMPTVRSEDFIPELSRAVTIGLQPATPDGVLIPIKRGTGTAKDSETDSVAGRLHTVSVSCDVDDRNADVWDSLFVLEREPSHLLLTFRGGARAVAVASEDTYNCTVERNGAKTTVGFRIQNLRGVQLIAESS